MEPKLSTEIVTIGRASFSLKGLMSNKFLGLCRAKKNSISSYPVCSSNPICDPRCGNAFSSPRLKSNQCRPVCRAPPRLLQRLAQRANDHIHHPYVLGSGLCRSLTIKTTNSQYCAIWEAPHPPPGTPETSFFSLESSCAMIWSTRVSRSVSPLPVTAWLEI